MFLSMILAVAPSLSWPPPAPQGLLGRCDRPLAYRVEGRIATSRLSFSGTTCAVGVAFQDEALTTALRFERLHESGRARASVQHRVGEAVHELDREVPIGRRAPLHGDGDDAALYVELTETPSSGELWVSAENRPIREIVQKLADIGEVRVDGVNRLANERASMFFDGVPTFAVLQLAAEVGGAHYVGSDTQGHFEPKGGEFRPVIVTATSADARVLPKSVALCDPDVLLQASPHHAAGWTLRWIFESGKRKLLLVLDGDPVAGGEPTRDATFDVGDLAGEQTVVARSSSGDVDGVPIKLEWEPAPQDACREQPGAKTSTPD